MSDKNASWYWGTVCHSGGNVWGGRRRGVPLADSLSLCPCRTKLVLENLEDACVLTGLTTPCGTNTHAQPM